MGGNLMKLQLNKQKKQQSKCQNSILRILFAAVPCLVLFYLVLLYRLFLYEGGHLSPSSESAVPEKHKHMEYSHWRQVAVNIARKSAREVVDLLKSEDPFGVRTFELALIEQESTLGRVLDLLEIRQLFPCPHDRRITLPDQRNATKAEEFRQGRGFLFFQHLRKAGGTHFCTLASKNLPPTALPDYYCMPDMDWPDTKGAGYLHSWSNAEIMKRIKQHRIAGNEWDNFDRRHHFDLPAVFATSFRNPLDRAISQFRFECIEDRGCKHTVVEEFWRHRGDLYDIYTTTFSDAKLYGLHKTLFGNSTRDAARRAEILGDALDVVAKFHLVTVMEWLAYAGPMITKVLGFQDTSSLTHRVRPHISQAKRNDGQETNQLGAASIGKASWSAIDYLSPQQYARMSEDLALDEILTDAARRIFLERLVC